MIIQGLDFHSITTYTGSLQNCFGPDDTCSEEQAISAENPSELSEEEKREVQELKTTDREVRAHEAAHVAAGGQYVRGGATFEYQTGPDGKRYAVGGEVSIDSSPISGDPQATINKMQVIRKAALAPAQPSGQDRAVAAAATRNETKARRELAKEKTEDVQKKDHSTQNPEQNAKNEKTSTYFENGLANSMPSEITTPVLDLVV